MKHAKSLIAALAFATATGAAAPACYANGTTIIKNTSPTNSAKMN